MIRLVLSLFLEIKVQSTKRILGECLLISSLPGKALRSGHDTTGSVSVSVDDA